MAANSVRFDRFYAASPLCSPTRGSCLTGRYPFRYGILAAHTAGTRVDEARRNGELSLFNLSSDPYETVDLAKDHLEQVKLLTERLTRLEQEALLSRDGNDYRY